MIKCITVKQPWASLIVEGIKDVENRTWKTNFRGRVLIHAGQRYDARKLPNTESYFKYIDSGLRDAFFYRGAIIGSVEIVDCVINHPSIWAEKTPLDKQIEDKCIWNWVLANPIKFDKPIPCKGKLSFWDFDETLIK